MYQVLINDINTIYKSDKWFINDLSFGYVEQHKSNKVIKRDIGTSDFRVLKTDIKKGLINQDLENSDVQNFPFFKLT